MPMLLFDTEVIQKRNLLTKKLEIENCINAELKRNEPDIVYMLVQTCDLGKVLVQIAQLQRQLTH